MGVASSDRLRRALDYIAAGRWVTLKLNDGREVAGQLRGLDDRGRIQIEDETGAQSISLMLVSEVVVDESGGSGA